MLKIGITGGIGTGKSIVSHLFALLNIPVYDSDLRAKQVMAHNPELKQELIAAFGPETFTAEGLNRTKLASIVFPDPEKLAQLNRLVHPHVKQDFINWAEENKKASYVLKEAALMFETEAYKQVDEMITVFAPLEIRMQRLLKRDSHRTEADLKNIIAKQLPEEEKLRRADHIIYNDDSQLVIPQVLKLHQYFLAKAAAKR
ncbi:dephospho-CoA kinase [Adhaeribacter sp. BT258]|uniref:Dephospho-CoA kinase n=1 Tax=Adhaeribacter terrigena TaxID=2793070 RepID=A0ABS1C273_9BACT|nr:dephospho-CoA kinase [Adhaeribacter terrigena]MBK0403424.1 dephospho-CoA kinase [Adhaeribacter terrigena]